MKKAIFLFAGLFFLFLSINIAAQEKKGAEYFAGKWGVLLKGTPSGDAKVYFNLEMKDSTLTGAMQDSTGNELAKITYVELKDTSVTLYFNTQGYDVNLRLNKKDEDHVTGSLVDMFEAVGDRIKK